MKKFDNFVNQNFYFHNKRYTKQLHVGTHNLGRFEVNSGKIIVTDPCYTPDTWCQKIVDNVENGVYWAFVNVENIDNGSGTRPSNLFIMKEDKNFMFGIQYKNFDWIHDYTVDIGVDSGQVGMFDFDKYVDLFSDDYDSTTGKYNQTKSPKFQEYWDEMGEITLGDKYSDGRDGYNYSGVYKDFGVASLTAYGDGSYSMYYMTDEDTGKINALMVDFTDQYFDIDENDQDDEFDYVDEFDEDL